MGHDRSGGRKIRGRFRTVYVLDMLMLALLAVPAAIALLALLRGSRLAVVPLMIFAGQATLVTIYMNTDFIRNPGLGGAYVVGVFPTLISLILALVSFAQTRGTARKSRAGDSGA